MTYSATHWLFKCVGERPRIFKISSFPSVIDFQLHLRCNWKTCNIISLFSYISRIVLRPTYFLPGECSTCTCFYGVKCSVCGFLVIYVYVRSSIYVTVRCYITLRLVALECCSNSYVFIFFLNVLFLIKSGLWKSLTKIAYFSIQFCQCLLHISWGPV